MPAKAGALTPDRSVRHLFGSEMRRLRLEADMSLAALADVVRYGKSSLARFETAEAMIPPDLPSKLDAAFGTDGLFAKLYRLARKEIHPDQFRRRMELETRAQLIEEYAGQLVPGIVQTEGYARALFEVANPQASANDIDELLTARMGRQTVLHGDPPTELSLILDEAVIRRQFGSAEVMRGQLQHLAGLTMTPTTTVQVLPFDHGGHALVGGTLTLLTQDDGTQVAYEESISTGTLIEEWDGVVHRRRGYDLLRSCALSPRQSEALIRTAMEGLRT